MDRRCNLEVNPFGELVFYKRLDDEGKKLDTRWEQGLWLGHARGSSEVLIGTDAGVVRAWATKRMEEAER